MENVKSCRYKRSATTKRKKANARERNRMHALNEAFDSLRKCFPLKNVSYNGNSYHNNDINVIQKLSKIETLKLAQNYIGVLRRSLSTNQKLPVNEFQQNLTRGLSQATMNVMRQQFKLDPILENNLLHSSDHNFCDVYFDPNNTFNSTSCYPIINYSNLMNGEHEELSSGNVNHGYSCSDSCGEDYFDTDSSSINSCYFANNQKI